MQKTLSTVGHRGLITSLRSLVHTQTCSYAAAAPARAAVQSTGKKRFRLPVESNDAEFLVTHVSGLNFLKEGESVKLKPDSDYPDWLWDLRLDRHPGHEAYDPNTKEFWEQVAFENFIRMRRLQKTANAQKMVVGKDELRRREWIDRIKHRAITAQDHDAGFDAKELREELNIQITMKPQLSTQSTLYLDEITIPKAYHY